MRFRAGVTERLRGSGGSVNPPEPQRSASRRPLHRPSTDHQAVRVTSGPRFAADHPTAIMNSPGSVRQECVESSQC